MWKDQLNFLAIAFRPIILKGMNNDLWNFFPLRLVFSLVRFQSTDRTSELYGLLTENILNFIEMS